MINQMPKMDEAARHEALRDAAFVVKETLYKWFDEPDPDLDEPIPTLSFSNADAPRLRLSYGNACARETWYAHNEPEAFARTGPERWKFFQGHVFEHLAQIGLSRRLPEPYSFPPEWVQREVVLDGIKGHTDGAIYLDGEPLALMDFKCTMPYAFNKWERRRKPTATWGYPHQAANYLAAARKQKIRFAGFIWAVGFRTDARWEAGWMSAEELKPWEQEAQRAFLAAQHDKKPPKPIHEVRDKSPCRYRDTIYCNAYEHCIRDDR